VSPRTHAEIEDLLGAYALDAVDPAEAAIVEEHLESCPRCRAEVSEHREVAAMLGNSGGAAPEGLWDRIAGSLEETPPPLRMPAAPVTPLPPRADRERRGVSARAVAALAVAAALLIGFLGAQSIQQQRRVDDLRSEVAERERLVDDLRDTLNEDVALRAANLALADPDARTTYLENAELGMTATAVVLPDGTGYLLAQELPELDETEAYQLWGVAGETVVSLGVLGADPAEVVPFMASGALDALAITEEVAGGVPVSEQPALLAGEFD
jgi:hypothetical protein